MEFLILQVRHKLIRAKGDKASKVKTNKDGIRENIIKEDRPREDKIKHSNALMGKHLLVSLVLLGPTDQL